MSTNSWRDAGVFQPVRIGRPPWYSPSRSVRELEFEVRRQGNVRRKLPLTDHRLSLPDGLRMRVPRSSLVSMTGAERDDYEINLWVEAPPHVEDLTMSMSMTTGTWCTCADLVTSARRRAAIYRH